MTDRISRGETPQDATRNRMVEWTDADHEAIWSAIGFAQGVYGEQPLPRWCRLLEDLGRRMAQESAT